MSICDGRFDIVTGCVPAVQAGLYWVSTTFAILFGGSTAYIGWYVWERTRHPFHPFRPSLRRANLDLVALQLLVSCVCKTVILVLLLTRFSNKPLLFVIWALPWWLTITIGINFALVWMGTICQFLQTPESLAISRAIRFWAGKFWLLHLASRVPSVYEQATEHGVMEVRRA